MSVILLSIPPGYRIKVAAILRRLYGGDFARRYTTDVATLLYNRHVEPDDENVRLTCRRNGIVGDPVVNVQLLRDEHEEQHWL